MSENMLGKLSLSETQGPRNDLEVRLAGPKGRMWLRALKKMLRREQSWGIPSTFEVTTDGRGGKQYIADLERDGFRVGDYIERFFRSEPFVATNGVTYKLVVIMGDEFEYSDRTNQHIREVAYDRRYRDPSIEVVPYLIEMFSYEDFKKTGLDKLIVMHKSITILSGKPCLLFGLVCNDVDECLELEAYHEEFQGPWSWDRGVGFVFLRK